MLGETEKSSDVCRTASLSFPIVVIRESGLTIIAITRTRTLSEMGHGQRAATSSTVTDQRRKNFSVRRSSFEIEVPSNRRVLLNQDYTWRIQNIVARVVN